MVKQERSCNHSGFLGSVSTIRTFDFEVISIGEYFLGHARPNLADLGFGGALDPFSALGLCGYENLRPNGVSLKAVEASDRRQQGWYRFEEMHIGQELGVSSTFDTLHEATYLVIFAVGGIHVERYTAIAATLRKPTEVTC